jgi:hypothetical protein
MLLWWHCCLCVWLALTSCVSVGVVVGVVVVVVVCRFAGLDCLWIVLLSS